MGNEEQASPQQPKAKPQKPEKGFFDKVWDFFASVKLAIVIFSVISLTSIVGTVLEQNADPQQNIKILSDMFGTKVAMKLYPVLDSMGFVNMYHSWWFSLLLGLFAINLLICSLDRLPRIWKLVTERQKPLKDEQLRAFPVKKEFVVSGSEQDARDKVTAALAKLGFKKLSVSEDQGYQFFGQRGAFTRLGVYVTHISILVIMTGALIGLFWGFNGILNLGEGETQAFAFSRNFRMRAAPDRNIILNALDKSNGDIQAAASMLGVDTERFLSRLKAIGIQYLGFELECKDFEVDFYGRSDMPKDYRSLLAVYQGGQEVKNMWIEVNKPLKYNGFTFYQSSYGPARRKALMTIKLVEYVRSNPQERQQLNLKIGDTFTLPGSDITATIAEYSPALSFDQSGRPFTYDEMMNNPAVRLSIQDGDLKYNRWVMKRIPDTWNIDKDHVVQLVDIWGAQYTGLQVRKDPGVWVVYLGCFLMATGLYMSFFMSHRRVWLKLESSGKGSIVRGIIAGSANKNREGFERAMNKVVSQLEDGGK